MYNGPERRKFKRIKANFMVLYKKDTIWDRLLLKEAKESYAIMSDLCESGMAIICDEKLMRFTPVLARFNLSSQKAASGNRHFRTIEVRGRVCYCKDLGKEGFRIGIRFKKLDEKQRHLLSSFIRHSDLVRDVI